ncbi:MAG: lytic transglycosylase domain-containing protein [Gammaproteobacteria bacterium]|nr:lytic transglycosylase domain-containing protein [Gammaproteobacteria bacterium]
MQETNNIAQTGRWGARVLLICACLCIAGLVSLLVIQPKNDTMAVAFMEEELGTNVSSPDIETAISAVFQEREKPDLVGSLEVKISSHFPIPQNEANEFANWIVQSADKHGIDEVLLTSIVATESSFRKDAVSHKGAIGPAQIMPKYWEEFCAPLDLSVPQENIECGARILSHLLEQCWDESCAIRSYNMGFPRVKAGKIFPSVERYERTVEQFKEVFAFNV